MANWDKHKPKGMSREELERRVADGRKRWIAKGWIPKDFDKPVGRIVARAEGPHLDKKGQARVIQCANLAIYALANGDRLDYLHAVAVINATRRLAGLGTPFIVAMCEGIAEAASVCCGRSAYELNMVARTWLDQEQRTGKKLISVPIPVPTSEEDDDGKDKDGAGDADPQGLNQQAPGEGDESELQPGEERGGAGGTGGPVGEDPAGAG